MARGQPAKGQFLNILFFYPQTAKCPECKDGWRWVEMADVWTVNFLDHMSTIPAHKERFAP
jgi:uncharacterized OB-fold protein